MKEEVKINNVACEDYEQHQFKHNYCAKCLKPLAQHSIISRTLEPVDVKIIELQTGDNNDGIVPEKSISNKFYNSVTSPISNGQHVNGTHNGFIGNNGIHVETRSCKNVHSSKKTPPQIKERPGPRLRRQSPISKGAEVLVKTNGQSIPRMRRADSLPENGSVSPVDVSCLTNPICPEIPTQSFEFQRVGKSLKRVNNRKFIEDDNNAQNSRSALTGKQDSPDIKKDSKDTTDMQDMKHKEELIAAKSDLPSQVLSSAAYSAFKIEKNDTLPRNIGSNRKRPSIGNLSEKHDSDPEMYEAEQKVEEINVVLLNGDTNSENKSQNKKVKGSQISSEIYFGMNVQSNRNNSMNNNHQSNMFLDSSREIVILAADGTISRCIESSSPPTDYRVSKNSSTLSNLSMHSSESSFSNSSSKVQPYRVVDLEVQECVETDSSNFEKRSYSNKSANIQNGQTKFQQRITLVDTNYTRKLGRKSSGEVPEYDEPADASPTLPKILHHEINALPRSAKRNSDSSLYRVPIFIGSNVEAINESSHRTPCSSTATESKSPHDDYLKPMRQSNSNSNDEQNVHNYDSVPESDFSDVSKSTSSSGESGGYKKQYRSRKSADINMRQKKTEVRTKKRSVTHPTSNSSFQTDIQGARKSIQFSDEDLENKETPVKMRQKRNAPPPPVENRSRRSLSLNQFTEPEVLTFSDTMPKVPPPPPPHQNLERKASEPVAIPKSNLKGSETNKSLTPPRQNGINSYSPKYTTLPANSKASPVCDKTPERNFDSKKRAAPVLNHLNQSLSPKKEETIDNIEKKEPVDPISDVLISYSPPRNGSPQVQSISPQRPKTLPVDNIEPAQPITRERESKGKWSKLPWRRNRSRRKEDGSPEREFNAKGVSDWLINKHMTEAEIAAVDHEENLQKLEVIKAYKGEPIPVINSSNVDYSAITSEHGQSKFYLQAHTPVDSPPLPRLTGNLSKRKAPGPPEFVRNDELLLEEFKTRKKKIPPKLQKSHSFTSVSSSIKDRSFDDYENWGPVRNDLPAPTKPSRRFRNRTTAFENLPSQSEANKKRMAPQVPQDVKSSREDSSRSSPNHSSQDETDKPQPMPRKRSNSAAATTFPVLIGTCKNTPLKSAMKNVEDSHGNIDNQTPKRPVRVLDPGHPAKPLQVDTSEVSKENAYANVGELSYNNNTASSRRPVPTPRIQKLMVDQGTSPIRTFSEQRDSLLTSLEDDIDPVIAKITKRNIMTLSKISSVWENSHESCPRLDEVNLKDFKLTQEQPCFSSSEAKLYPAEYGNEEKRKLTLMVFTDQESMEPLYKFIMSTKLLLPHPNILNICSASKACVSNNLIQPEPSPSKCQEPINQSTETIESLVVATAVQPVSSVARFVNYSKEKHNFLPEQYEGEVINILLQLFSGLQHLENNNISLSTVKMENLLLVDSGLPGGGNYLVVDYLSLAEREESETVNGTLLSPSIINKTNEFDVGILIYKMLHEPNPFSVKTNLIIREYQPNDLPKIPEKSRYSCGLQKLAGELLRKTPTDRLSARQSIGLLQLLRWGPSIDDLAAAENEGLLDMYLAKWRTEECTKMVNSIAEQQVNAIFGNSNGFSMTDQQHCQFLSEIDFTLMKTSFKLLKS